MAHTVVVPVSIIWMAPYSWSRYGSIRLAPILIRALSSWVLSNAPIWHGLSPHVEVVVDHPRHHHVAGGAYHLHVRVPLLQVRVRAHLDDGAVPLEHGPVRDHLGRVGPGNLGHKRTCPLSMTKPRPHLLALVTEGGLRVAYLLTRTVSIDGREGAEIPSRQGVVMGLVDRVCWPCHLHS